MDTADRLFSMGFRIAIYPAAPLYAAAKAAGDLLRESGDLRPCMEREVDFPAFNRMIGLEELRALEASFSPRG